MRSSCRVPHEVIIVPYSKVDIWSIAKMWLSFLKLS